MPLRDAIVRPDTRGELESSAEDRFWDGLIPATSEEGREIGSVYLLGYVAEMLLKSAYYRIRGVPSDVDVRPELRGMPARARALGFAWQGNRHNLESVTLLLIAERRLQGNRWMLALRENFYTESAYCLRNGANRCGIGASLLVETNSTTFT